MSAGSPHEMSISQDAPSDQLTSLSSVFPIAPAVSVLPSSQVSSITQCDEPVPNAIQAPCSGVLDAGSSSPVFKSQLKW